jgi:DNA-binding transcriptional LysR family regulator
MHVELRHLRYFLAVAEELNFSRAAERMHVAQPALSAQIRALEAQLGCALFTRTTRRVVLTPQGELLLEDVRDILVRVDAALAKVRAAGRTERRVLRIGFAAHGGGEVGMEILRRFKDRSPSTGTELVSASTLRELQRHLRDRATDVAFVWLPLLYDELTAQPILVEPRFVAMHPGHALAEQPAVFASDLAKEPIVAPWEHIPPELLAVWLGEFRPDGRRPGDRDAMSVDESLALASTGVGLYCVPESVSRFYARPDVTFRPIVDVAPAQVAIAWRTDAANPALEEFIETARSVVDEERPGEPTIQTRGA